MIYVVFRRLCGFFVGQGTITAIRENNRESYNVKRGDIIRVPSGNTFYVTNTDDDEKLYIVKFIKSINLPGQCEVYYMFALFPSFLVFSIYIIDHSGIFHWLLRTFL